MRRIHAAGLTATLLATFTVMASACTFTFSYGSISAPIGAVGEVGIRVQKTHARCTLSSTDEYLIGGDGIQILGETPWEDLGDGLYEKWVQLSLAEEGDGFVRISKICTKEGYEEGVLPITVLAPDEDAAWATAWDGEYPFEQPDGLGSIVDRVAVDDTMLAVGALTVALPDGVTLPASLPETVRVFYTNTSGEPVALLLVGEGLFIRFDHLIG